MSFSKSESSVAMRNLSPFHFHCLSRRSLFGALLVCSGAFGITLVAAETNVVEAIRDALAARPAAWGEVSVGEFSRTDPDPRAMAVANGLRQIAARRLANQAAPPAAVPAGHALTQQAAIDLLRRRAEGDVDVRIRPGNRTIAQIRGQVLERPAAGLARAMPGEREERTARNFLRANRELMRLEDPDNELVLAERERDALGYEHLRFSQSFKGVAVWPAGLSVHVDARSNVQIVDGAYVPTPAGVSVLPVLRPQEAAERARRGVPNGARGLADVPALIIYASLDQAPRLAWKFNLSTDFAHAWMMIVDAQDGRVLNRITQHLDANVAGNGKDLEGTVRNLNVWSQDGKFYLADTTKPMFKAAFDPIKDPHGVITMFDAQLVTTKDLKTVFITESTSATNWLADAVSAQVNFSQTFDYFFERHNRSSLDGQGGNIQAAVRVAELDNAFWNGQLKMMFFGNVRPYPLALDVVGHELTHGVTQNSADLIYELQPGAMNEAFSDIFGAMVEARATGQADWKIGEKLGKVFRDLKDPGSLQIGGLNRPYPSKMSEYIDLPNNDDSDHGGVHINSSIINHAFYLLAEGLPGAIGTGDAEKIFYRCLTAHLQKQSQFIDARLGCLASAEALFGAGSTQAKKVEEAFDAVEILATPATPDPSPIPIVQGPDSTLFVYSDLFTQETLLGRRETARGDPIDGVAMVESIKSARPAVSGNGSFALFVDSANDVCGVDTDNPNSLQCLGFQGVVHSVAVSPDENLFAFVLRDVLTGQAENRINVYDFVRNTNRTYKLLAPVLDGSPVDNVLYADSMVFTADGKQLIYDALSQIRFGGGSLVQRWSVFRINLATETTTVLVPPLEGLDTGNPNVGRAGNRYLTLDAQDTKTGNTTIINLDLFTGDLSEVATVGAGLGFPSFTGDESAVIYAAEDRNAFNTGFSLFKQPLAADRLTRIGQPSLWLSDATIGVIYRRGTFSSSNALPTVNLTSPANNANFSPPATITLTADASDSDGTVAKVEFYEGADKLGETAALPYRFTWSNVAAGNYRVVARAIDNLGAAADSTAVSITVGQTGPGVPIKLSASRLANNGIRVTLNAPAGNYVFQQSTNLVNWLDLRPVAVDGSGKADFDDTGAAASNRLLFYRARKN